MLSRLYSTKTRGKTRVWWNPSLVPRPLTSKTLFLCCSFLHGLLVALCPFSYVHSPIVKVNSDSDVFWCNLSVGSEAKCASFCKVSLAVEYDVWLKVIWSGRFSYGDYCKNNINVCVTMTAKSIFTHAVRNSTFINTVKPEITNTLGHQILWVITGYGLSQV